MNDLIIVRGGGDIATGTIYRLKKAGFPVLILDLEHPSVIRREVAFAQAMYEGVKTVEDMTCYRVQTLCQARELLREGKLCILADPQGRAIERLHPAVVVDAILAKKNLGTSWDMAPLTIALGPGFTAGEDVDYVIETMRGHHLGRIYTSGSAIPDTGIPGTIAGFDKERVLHAPAAGIFHARAALSSVVEKGQLLGEIETPEGMVPVTATIPGLLRGLIQDGYPVPEGFKIADIDPRLEEKENCTTISDKARCIAGGVLEAILRGKP